MKYQIVVWALRCLFKGAAIFDKMLMLICAHFRVLSSLFYHGYYAHLIQDLFHLIILSRYFACCLISWTVYNTIIFICRIQAKCLLNFVECRIGSWDHWVDVYIFEWIVSLDYLFYFSQERESFHSNNKVIYAQFCNYRQRKILLGIWK